MKKLTLLIALLLLSFNSLASSSSDKNKELVVNFYNEVFLKAQPEKLDEFIGDKYIQHNPTVPDGKEAVRNLITNYIAPIVKGGGTVGKIIRVIAEGNLVAVHVKFNHYPSEKGGAVVDIFRVENGKIVEHWDVVQELPQSSVNDNGMF